VIVICPPQGEGYENEWTRTYYGACGRPGRHGDCHDGCDKLKARDQLNKGVDAYKSARYEEAIGHFQKATQLDPELPMAKSYLATALAQNVVPGLETQENLNTPQQAIDIFQEVLSKDPSDVNSMSRLPAFISASRSWTMPGHGRRRCSPSTRRIQRLPILLA